MKALSSASEIARVFGVVRARALTRSRERYMTLKGDRWRELPYQGELKELAVIGNGKDSIMRLTVPNGRALAVALSGARTSVTCCRGIRVDTAAVDDTELVVRYLPQRGWTMQLVRAQIDYPGSDEDWARDCEVWNLTTGSRRVSEGSWEVLFVAVELQAAPLP